MAIRIVSIILLLSVPSFSESLGDFAPLEMGNRWEYTYQSSSFAKFGRSKSLSIIIQIIDQTGIGKTYSYILRYRISGTERSMVGATATEKEVSEVQYDTIVEVDQNLKEHFFYSPLMEQSISPIWNRHYIERSALATFPTAEQTIVITDDADGTRTFTLTEAEAGTNISSGSSVTFRSGIGLTNYQSFTSFPIAGSRVTMTLISFSNKPVSIAPAGKLIAAKTRNLTLPAEKLLSLPNLSISSGHRTFDLLGRHGDGNKVNTMKFKFHTIR